MFSALAALLLWLTSLLNPPTLVGTVALEFGDRADEAACVASAESGWHDEARGALGEAGLFQIHPIHAGNMASLGLSYDDPHDRIRYAALLVSQDGWRAHWYRASILCGL